MKNDHVVIINGQAYDSVTGQPAPQPALKPVTKPRKNFQDIKVVPKIVHPAKPKLAASDAKPVNTPMVGRLMDVAKNKSVEHFAKHHTPSQDPSTHQNHDIAPTKHPLISRAKQTITRPILKRSAPRTMSEIKNEAIEEALSRPQIVERKPKIKMTRRAKIISIIAVCLILLFGGGYLVYLYTPSFSVKFASAQAGIDAEYPEYVPDGYSVEGPISYADKQVTINFKANAGNTRFAITQVKSSWDSSALKDDVEKESKGEFKTTTINGLTIFSFDGSAAWVNDGILYEISGDAHLLLSQIQKIATSL